MANTGLIDPLFLIRWHGVRIMIIPSIAATAVFGLQFGTVVDFPEFVLIASAAYLLAVSPVILWWLSLLPRQPVNALYLRSFRNDYAGQGVKVAVQRALGREFRLAGIRSPAHRSSALDYLALVLLALRYSTPRYMSLEGSSDWQRQLIQTLENCRCVIIDLRDLTDFVRWEIEACLLVMGSSCNSVAKRAA